MGALPKRKISSHRQGKRRKSIKLTKLNLISCPNCSAKKLSHRICQKCGKYS